MASRFASGESTFKFDRACDEEVIIKMEKLSNAVMSTAAVVDTKLADSDSKNDRRFHQLSDKIESLKPDIDRTRSTLEENLASITDFHYVYEPMIYKFLCGKLARFLNWFGHWYVLDIAQHNYRYMYTITIMSNSSVKSDWKLYHDQFRKHLKEITDMCDGPTHEDLIKNGISNMTGQL